MYYFHTKGLKSPDDPLINVFTSRRQILDFYTLKKFNINLQLLDKYDAIGCSLHLYPKLHFSGNFWWSKSSYLKTLDNINDNYLSPEMYILSNDNCKYISLANDTNNILYENYDFRNDDIIINSITTELIIINEHQQLIVYC